MTAPEKFLIALLAAAILPAGCGQASPARLAPEPSPVKSETAKPEPAKTEPAPVPVPRPPEKIARQSWTAGSPEARAQAFYDWYMDYAKTRGNVVVDEAYRNSHYLHPEWVARVDAKVKEWREARQPGLDPFLCAQNVGDELIAGPADIAGTEAALMAYHGPWGGPKTWSAMEVYLTMYGDQWRITRIVCRR
ncbi:MAG: hypothetical protein ACOY94_07210 [Bacillota bacterium]